MKGQKAMKNQTTTNDLITMNDRITTNAKKKDMLKKATNVTKISIKTINMDQTENHKILIIMNRKKITTTDIIIKNKEPSTVTLFQDKNTITTVTTDSSIKNGLIINTERIKDIIIMMKGQKKVTKTDRIDKNHTNKDNKAITTILNLILSSVNGIQTVIHNQKITPNTQRQNSMEMSLKVLNQNNTKQLPLQR